MTMPGTDGAPTLPYAGRSSRRRALWLGIVLALLAVLCALSVAIGTRDVSLADITAALAGRVETVAEAAVAVRLPRTVLALLAGAALGLAGAIMQGVTRNPLADPGILGVNMGASLAVVIAIVWFGIASSQAMAPFPPRPPCVRRLPPTGPRTAIRSSAS